MLLGDAALPPWRRQRLSTSVRVTLLVCFLDWRSCNLRSELRPDCGFWLGDFAAHKPHQLKICYLRSHSVAHATLIKKSAAVPACREGQSYEACKTSGLIVARPPGPTPSQLREAAGGSGKLAVARYWPAAAVAPSPAASRLGSSFAWTGRW